MKKRDTREVMLAERRFKVAGGRRKSREAAGQH
jgi:hypothetical protein